MKLANCDFETIFDLNSDTVNVLVIESEQFFFKYCSELNLQVQGESGNFCLSDDKNIVPLAKNSAIFTDMFNISLNDKKICTKLFAYLGDLINNNLIVEMSRLRELWADIFNKLNAESDCQLDYDGGEDLSAIFKAFGVKIAEDDSNLLNHIVVYISICSSLMKIKNFFFVNLKCFLNDNELLKLYHEAQLNEVNLFLLENTERPHLENEKVVILDKDLCEIVAT